MQIEPHEFILSRVPLIVKNRRNRLFVFPQENPEILMQCRSIYFPLQSARGKSAEYALNNRCVEREGKSESIADTMRCGVSLMIFILPLVLVSAPRTEWISNEAKSRMASSFKDSVSSSVEVVS